MEINDSIALVTGANRGLGRALVDALLEQGARRVYAAARDTSSLTAHGDQVIPVRLDLTSAADIAAAAVQAPDVNLLVNNASAAYFADPLTAERDKIALEMATNYTGTVDLTRAFVPVIEQTGRGAVVNVLSLLALASTPPMAGYSASKAAHRHARRLRRSAKGQATGCCGRNRRRGAERRYAVVRGGWGRGP